MYEYNELNRVEKPAIDLFTQLGYAFVDAYHDKTGPNSTLGRQTESEVVLEKYLRPALARLNKDILETVPEQAGDLIDKAVIEIKQDRSNRSQAEANREVYRLLKEGLKISLTGENKHDETQSITLQYIDWDDKPGSNHYLLVSQLWIRHDIYKRRPDLLGFVNGIPLIFIEFKAIHERLEHAYNNNLKDYKTYIPQLFWYNALIILSNGRESRMGSLTAGWEHFSAWTKIASEDEPPKASLETIIRGICEPKRLLDIVENFTLFSDESEGLKKIIARNHQYLGVNNAIHILQHRQEHHNKLGVFWHTQGSGKSYSMVFFVQKVNYKLKGNWTFLIVTDREDLDKQIYQTFKNVDAVKGDETHARGGEHLQTLLKEDHRVIFTTIHKFHLRKLKDNAKSKKDQKQKTKKTKRVKYPELTDRSNVIVISDEAHRSQYSDLSDNMRDALPNAAYIGFTGTPLIEGEEREETRKKFGDYISTYNFGHSITDGTTVPLFYENRSPDIQVINSEINAQISEVLDEAEIEDDDEGAVQRKFKELYNVITLDPRLETIAEDIAQHFMRRGYRGKAMVVSIDKMTAVKMYDKVQKYWKIEIDKLKAQLQATDEHDETQEDMRAKLQYDISYMEATDMAVVVSSEQNEDAKFQDKGLDIQTHRRRMETQDLEGMFKSSIHNLRIVFVCAMWMTGFDVPSLSTVYLDKPMRNHTLMQTIARANRVFRSRENGLKVNGLIVDYLGIFNDLRRALAIYAANQDQSTTSNGAMPIQNKRVLLPYLQAAVQEVEAFCQKQGIDLPAILAASTMDSIHLLTDAANKIVISDETQKQYISLVASAERYYNAILPDRKTQDSYEKRVALLVEIARIIYSFKEPTDVSSIMEDINNLMSKSVATKDYVVRKINESSGYYILPERIDLSKIDYEALAEDFRAGNQAIKYERLRGKIAGKVQHMVGRNKKRINYQEEFQRMIDEYNQGSANQEIHYYKLLQFMKKLGEEDQRHIKEGLTEEELALYDIVLLPNIKLSPDEKERIKKIVSKILTTLKKDKLRSDWHTKQQTSAQVRNVIRDELKEMPSSYLHELHMLVGKIYEHVASTYDGTGKSIYDQAG